MAHRQPSLDEATTAQRAELHMPKAALEVKPLLDPVLGRGIAKAIAQAAEPDCENTDGWWVVNAATGVAVPRSCKRWQCPACRQFKRLAVLVALQHGLAEFNAKGHQVHALTLTDGS